MATTAHQGQIVIPSSVRRNSGIKELRRSKSVDDELEIIPPNTREYFIACRAVKAGLLKALMAENKKERVSDARNPRRLSWIPGH